MGSAASDGKPRRQRPHPLDSTAPRPLDSIVLPLSPLPTPKVWVSLFLCLPLPIHVLDRFEPNRDESTHESTPK